MYVIFLIAQNIGDPGRRTIIHIGGGNARPLIGGMDDFSVTHIDGHMIDAPAAAAEFPL